jgi:hypothetical protein
MSVSRRGSAGSDGMGLQPTPVSRITRGEESRVRYRVTTRPSPSARHSPGRVIDGWIQAATTGGSISTRRPSTSSTTLSLSNRFAALWIIDGYEAESFSYLHQLGEEVGPHLLHHLAPVHFHRDTGISTRSETSSCKSRPLRSGREMSSTRQLGVKGRGRARNSRADAKSSGRQPSDRSSNSGDSRTDMSSSTTKTTGASCDVLKT